MLFGMRILCNLKYFKSVGHFQGFENVSVVGMRLASDVQADSALEDLKPWLEDNNFYMNF
jgi:hypothetical protein